MLNGVVEHTLFVANDNDFVADANQFFVFGFTDSDLPGFVQKQLVLEPTSLAVLSAGLLGFGLLRRRPKERQPGAAVY
jgi:hypothetical protein